MRSIIQAVRQLFRISASASGTLLHLLHSSRSWTAWSRAELPARSRLRGRILSPVPVLNKLVSSQAEGRPRSNGASDWQHVALRTQKIRLFSRNNKFTGEQLALLPRLLLGRRVAPTS